MKTYNNCTRCNRALKEGSTDYYCNDCRNASNERWRRKNEGRTYIDSKSGYVVHIGYEHPMAGASGVTRHHRLVLWDKLEGQDAPCHWCGTQLVWGKNMTVDHLNWERADNRPENLVPSCYPCNIKRRRRPVVRKPCIIQDCTREASAKSLCTTHYEQRKSGKVPGEIQRRLSKEEKAEMIKDIRSGMTITEAQNKYKVNMSSIARGFKYHTGMSVREYRRQSKAEREAGHQEPVVKENYEEINTNKQI